MTDIHISIPSRPHITLAADRHLHSDEELAALKKEYLDAILAAINALCIPRIVVENDVLSQVLAPNTLYIFTERTNNLTLTLGEPLVGKVSEYHCFIVAGATAPTVTYPDGIMWNGGNAPTIAAGKIYEISILGNIAARFEVEPATQS